MNRKARRSSGKPAKGPDPQDMQRLIALCRAQRFAEAAPQAREFTRKWPQQAVGWHALAACLQAIDDNDGAIRAYRRALSIEPDNADGHNNLGLLLANSGAPEEAIRSYRRALRIRPGFLFAHYNLGLALSSIGSREEGNACYRKVLELQPDFAEAHNSLGNNLEAMGDPEGAAKSYRAALRMQPEHAQIHSNLGNVLGPLGHPREAEACHRRALELRPGHAPAMNNLGLLLAGQGRLEEAERIYRDALGHDPGFVRARHNLGNLLRDSGRPAEAESCYREALRLQPDFAAASLDLGNALMDLGRLSEAEACHRRVTELRPDDPAAHRNLGNVLAVLGRAGEAGKAFSRALEIEPNDAESWYHFSRVRRFDENDAYFGRLEALRADPGLSPRQRMYLHYAAGKAHADAGHADSAFECWLTAGRCRQESTGEDPGAERVELESIMRTFTTERLAALDGAGDPTRAPIFIVGMPRSGTTLVEQILASHERVHGAGERRDLERVVAATGRAAGGSFPEGFEHANRDHVTRLGERYRQAVVDAFEGVERVTDKMPDNFRFLGLIAAALPNARIVHVVRDPADTCLSCFERPFFGKYAFSCDLESLGHYYRAHARLMEHWHRVLPAERMLELRYEELVDDPGTHVRSLLDYCGLAWDERCLQFHETRRAVPTASLMQVRQPLYRTSIGRWRQYRDHLGPLLEALGPLAPEDR